MTLSFHPAVQNDFNAAIAYYEVTGGGHLADRFENEFQACLAAIKAGPTHHPRYHFDATFRRIRLPHFPYIILYREMPPRHPHHSPQARAPAAALRHDPPLTLGSPALSLIETKAEPNTSGQDIGQCRCNALPGLKS